MRSSVAVAVGRAGATVGAVRLMAGAATGAATLSETGAAVVVRPTRSVEWGGDGTDRVTGTATTGLTDGGGGAVDVGSAGTAGRDDSVTNRRLNAATFLASCSLDGSIAAAA